MALDNGQYWIYPSMNTSIRLDVTGGTKQNGAQIGVWEKNVGNAQIFEVRDSKNGGKLILSRYSGKGIDGNGTVPVAGNQVIQWDCIESNAQRWVMAETGTTMTYGGETYPTYYIKLHSNQSLGIKISAAAGGQKAILAASGGDPLQEWLFVPVPAFRDNGVYEIRSLLNTGMALDIESGSKANGANVILYSANGNNNQKFILHDEGNGYSIRSMMSDKYIDVAGGTLAAWTNVLQWQDNDQRNQRWRITTYGTVTVSGKECQVVEFGAANGTQFLMDVQGAMATNLANILIWPASHENNQKFVLLETDLEDRFLPTPMDIRFADSGRTEAVQKGSEQADLRIMFDVPSSWSTYGPAHFEMRYRDRSMGVDGQWGEYGDWAAWSTITIETSDMSATSTTGFDHLIDLGDERQHQWQVELRSVAGTGSVYPINTHSASVSGILTLRYEPVVTWGAATWTPLGIDIRYDTDWEYSMLAFALESDLSRQYETDWLGQSGTLRIPYEYLREIPDDGHQLNLVSRIKTADGAGEPRTDTIEVTKDVEGMTPTLVRDGYTLLASIDGSGTKRCWVYHDGMLVECVADDSGAFDVAYPIGKGYVLYAMAGDSVMMAQMAAEAFDGCAWYTENGSLYARYVIRGSESESYEQSSEQYALDSRRELSVQFGPTRTTELSVSFRLLGDELLFADVLGMVGEHVIYRSRNGELVPVAVTDADRSIVTRGVTDIKLGMTKETR